MSREATNEGLDLEGSGDGQVPDLLIGDPLEVAEGVWLLPGFGNTTIVLGSEGAAVVDPGLFINGPRVVEALRALTDAPVRYVIYTHGHYDHAFGTPALLEDAAERGHDAPEIVGHVNIARRFARYEKTAGHIATTFDAQFASWGRGGGDVVRNAIYHPPTTTFEDTVELGLGGVDLQCRHGLGETDDHAWVWIPQRRLVVGGDFIVSSLPNAGTPFRVQRYVLEWAEALDEMASLEPQAVISGHGGVFTDDAAEMLSTTADACRWLDAEVVRRLNDGQWDEQIIREVTLPAALDESRYLRPLYGCTAFAVRDILRRYTGWYDGNPTSLFPATRASIGAEVLSIIGDAAPVLWRVDELVEAGDVDSLQLSLHLLDLVVFADIEASEGARRKKAEVLEARSEAERSFVAKNVLRSASAIERDRLD